MKLPDNTGISCDICGTSYRNDFVYYSYDIRQVEVQGNRKPDLDTIFSLPLSLSLDICQSCFEKHKTLIISNYEKILSPQRRTRIEVVCEISGAVFVGTYIYYYVVVTKVTVGSTPTSVCAKCKKPGSGICKSCAGKSFVNLFSLATVDRFIEFNISPSVFQEYLESVERLRRLAGAWSTSSQG